MGSVLKLLTFPDIDSKKTGKNVKDFFKHDYPKLERFAGYDGMIKSPVIDGLPHTNGYSNPDKKFVVHASYSELLNAVKDAAGKCGHSAQLVITKHYMNNVPLYLVADLLSISSKTMYNKQDIYLVEFADRLLTSTSRLGRENIIDLHSYL